MADNFLFEVDASKIIAKLHLAGRQPLKIDTGVGEMLANTGIKDDDMNAKPDNPGKVTFDLTNNSKEYQVGYVVPIMYHKNYGIDEALKKVKDAYQKAIGKDSRIDSTIDSKEQKEFSTAIDTLLAMLNKDDQPKKSDLVSEEKINELDAIVQEQQKVDEDNYKKEVATAKNKALKQIVEYMNVFAGKDNVGTINEESFGQVFVADTVKDPNDKNFIANFEFQEASDADKQKMEAAFRSAFEKDPGKPNCKHRICFFVGYTLDAEK